MPWIDDYRENEDFRTLVSHIDSQEYRRNAIHDHIKQLAEDSLDIDKDLKFCYKRLREKYRHKIPDYNDVLKDIERAKYSCQ